MMKTFNLPINDERVQSVTEEQLELMEWCSIVADPEKLKKLENYFYDPDYDKELEDTDRDETSSIKFSNKSTSDEDIPPNDDRFIDQDNNLGNNVEDEDYDDEWKEL